jgi:hypothetical protein
MPPPDLPRRDWQHALAPLHAEDILALAETGRAGPARFALAVLARAMPGRPAEEARALSVGRRDAELMEINSLTFGPILPLVSRCPHCRTETEIELAPAAIGLSCAAVSEHWETRVIPLGAGEANLRPVTAGDLADLEGVGDPGRLRQALLRRCLPAGIEAKPGELGLIEQALAELDPAAEILLDMTCPACRSTWEECLDPPAILRSHIEAEARRLLGEVAELARLYHWSERDILALPPARRRFYLEAGRA